MVIMVAAAMLPGASPRWLPTLLIISSLTFAASASVFDGRVRPTLPTPFLRRAPPGSLASNCLTCRGGGEDAAESDVADDDDTSARSGDDDAALSELSGIGATCVLDLRPESVRTSSPVSAGSVADIFGAAAAGKSVGSGGGGFRAAVLVPLPASTDIDTEALPPSSSNFLLGTFPGDGEGTTDDSEQIEAGLHRLSSAAECLGSTCDSVVLLVAVSESDGATSLHRSAGLMLAGLMNGMRQRRSQGKEDVGDRGMKLTLLLSPLENEEEGSNGGDEEFDKNGAERLVEKLREFHSMMGMGNEPNAEEEGGSKDPFEATEIISFGHRAMGPSLDATMLLRENGTGGQEKTALSTAKIQELISDAYEAMGGVGTINCSEINV